VLLRFTGDALDRIAHEAIQRRSGARGLRAILETRMLDIMYNIPSLENVKECIINKDVVMKQGEPVLVFEKKQESA